MSPRSPAPHPLSPRPPWGDHGSMGVQTPPLQGPPTVPGLPLSSVKRCSSNLRFVPWGLAPHRPPPPLRSPPVSMLCSRRPSRDEPTQTSGSVQTPAGFRGLAGTGCRPLPLSLRRPRPSRQPASDTPCRNYLGSRTELHSASSNSGRCRGHPPSQGPHPVHLAGARAQARP